MFAIHRILQQLRAALGSLVVFTVLTGAVYPLAVTGLAQVLFPAQANGSLLVVDGQAAGSALVGQPFDDPGYFWGRPSATAVFPYNAFNAAGRAASAGSNLGPLNPALLFAVRQRIAALQAADPLNTSTIPVDLVTASASGLDPHISAAAAYYQARRVARQRGLSIEQVHQLIAQHLENRQLGILGEPRLNVLQLNLALDKLAGR